MFFDANEYDLDLTFFDIPGSDFNDISRVKTDLFSVKEGFMKGNLFKELYKPYKNLTYLPLNPRTERERKLYDLNLYLDLNPNDQECLKKIKEYIMEEKKLTKEYEMMYGPLTINGVEGNSFKWINNPFPWDNEGGSMYV